MKEKIKKAIICKLNEVIEYEHPIDPTLPKLIEAYYNLNILDPETVASTLHEIIQQKDEWLWTK